MRICRFEHQGTTTAGFYFDESVVPASLAAKAYSRTTGEKITLPTEDDLLAFLPPQESAASDAEKIANWLEDGGSDLRIPLDTVQLLVPIQSPNKILLLAGNYAKHIEEGGGVAKERAATFPYVFMKPPTTTLTHPGKPVIIPAISPNAIDWELELAVIIGRKCKAVNEADALNYVAGYTIVNDISNRQFRPNPDRQQRDRDKFFDWLHGKWFDSSCPCGPCIASPMTITDPQSLKMQLFVSGQMHQDASTASQIFPVAAVIEFISSFVTLQPGDIISTGTPSGVGSAKGIFLVPGDSIEASIESIGSLRSPVIAETT